MNFDNVSTFGQVRRRVPLPYDILVRLRLTCTICANIIFISTLQPGWPGRCFRQVSEWSDIDWARRDIYGHAWLGKTSVIKAPKPCSPVVVCGTPHLPALEGPTEALLAWFGNANTQTRSPCQTGSLFTGATCIFALVAGYFTSPMMWTFAGSGRSKSS